MNVKQQVIQARQNGYSYSEIQQEFGVPKSTARDWVVAETNKANSSVAGHVNQNLREEKPQKFDKSLESVMEFLSELAPIKVQSRDKSIISNGPSDYAVVIGDLHFPQHCQQTIDIFLQTIQELQPKTVILNGDTLDLLSISRYPKDIRHNYSLKDERVAYHEFLNDLLSVVGMDTVIYETSANHSGNSVEGRWWRYLSERLGELTSLPEIRDTLSYENVFLGDYKKYIQMVDYVQLTDDFVVLHGDVVRKNGGASARGLLDKWFTSLMHNHTHRFGFTAQRVPGLGNKQDKQLYGWENGCACSLDPVYASAPNWQQGFSIVGLDDYNFSVEQVMVNNGMANIATLGKTLYPL